MRDGVCPKCASEEVYYADTQPSGMLAGEGQPLLRIYKDKSFWPDVTLVEMNIYVCRACGYVEMHATDTGKLEKLADATNWHKVWRKV
jgi:predicted nucleic-acid-binding Zn-ribbon protein